MDLLLDPFVLALPMSNPSREACLDYIERLTEWSQQVAGQHHRFHVSAKCIDALLQAGQYPEKASLLAFLKTKAIPAIDFKVVCRACDHLLNHFPYMEERLDIPPLRLHSIEVDPDVVRRLDQLVAEALGDTLSCVTYAREASRHPLASALAMVTDPTTKGECLHIDAVVEVPTSGRGKSILETDLRLIQTPKNLVLLEELADIWQDTDKALAWTAEALARKEGVNTHVPWSSYSVSPEFNESIRAMHYDDQPDLLAQVFWQVARLLTGRIPHNESHANHRLLKDGKSLEVADDRAGKHWEAWRLWVTRAAPAIRLHYWWQSGYYVLSKVGPHEDYSPGPVPKNYSISPQAHIAMKKLEAQSLARGRGK